MQKKFGSKNQRIFFRKTKTKIWYIYNQKHI